MIAEDCPALLGAELSQVTDYGSGVFAGFSHQISALLIHFSR
jgi:hypothetical protein